MEASILLLILALVMGVFAMVLFTHRPGSQDSLFDDISHQILERKPEMTDPIFPLPETSVEVKPRKPRAPKKPPLPSDSELARMTKTQILELAAQRGLELDRKLTKALIIDTLKAQPTTRKSKKP